MTLKQKVIGFFQHEPVWYWRHYRNEMGCIILFMIAFVNFWIGSEQNNKIANNFRIIIPTLFNEFQVLGCDKVEQKSYGIMQKSYSHYEYFASGRKNLSFMEFKMYLIRRQCMLTRFSYDMFYGTFDQMVIEAPIDLLGRDLPLEFLICRRRDLKAKMTEMPYL